MQLFNYEIIGEFVKLNVLKLLLHRLPNCVLILNTVNIFINVMEGACLTISHYCSKNDFVTALQTISDDISVINLPPIPEYNRDDPGITIASLINTVWTLLQNRQEFVDSQHNLEQKAYVSSQDLIYSKEKLKRLEKSLADNHDSLINEKKKAILSESEHSQTLHHSKSLKQEIRELKQQLKGRENQFKHDLQRQQNEISELQSKLRKILSKERGNKWRGPVDNSDKYKFTDNDQINSMEILYQKSIHRLENNVHTLVKENLELRKLLDNVSEDLAQLMAQTCLIKESSEAPPAAGAIYTNE